MSGRESVPLFVDTGAFYARFDACDEHHGAADAVFAAIADGDLAYRPVYTSTWVLDELATLVLSRQDHATAVRAIERVVDSSTRVVHPQEDDFEAARGEFERYDDRAISFTDHMSGVLAADRDVDHVFTIDVDDFGTLGFTPIPDEIDVP